MRTVAGVLLAAGSGARFGADKLLAQDAAGTPVGVGAARALRRALPWAVAVVRPGAPERARRLSAAGLTLVVNARPEAGLGASLARGVAATAGARGWVIALADMPWIRPVTIRAVAQALLAGASIVVPEYRGRRGHPVGFGAAHRETLLALDADRGARDLLAHRSGEVLRLAVDDLGVLMDVDTPADLDCATPPPRAVDGLPPCGQY